MPVEIVALEARVLSHRFGKRPKPLSLGSALRRDMVLVRVTCADGTIGYGEAFHGQAGTAVAEIINTTMQDAVLGRQVNETVAVNDETYRRFLLGTGMSGGFQLALSGIDIAMWDAYGKVVGQPVYRLLGGSRQTFDTYAGGFTLGFSEPSELVAEVGRMIEKGYSAIKVRVGDTLSGDLARIAAVREAFGDGLTIMTDANLGLNYDAARLAPGLGKLGVEWLEEPYPRQSLPKYVALRKRGLVSIAAGENLAGAAQFADWARRGAIDVLQPDVSRAGGITELLRIAAIASGSGLRFVPHISHSVINHAATLHVMSAAGVSDLFEADPTSLNPFRIGVLSGGVTIMEGIARLSDEPGLGVTVDEERLSEFPGESGSPWPRPKQFH